MLRRSDARLRRPHFGGNVACCIHSEVDGDFAVQSTREIPLHTKGPLGHVQDTYDVIKSHRRM